MAAMHQKPHDQHLHPAASNCPLLRLVRPELTCFQRWVFQCPGHCQVGARCLRRLTGEAGMPLGRPAPLSLHKLSKDQQHRRLHRPQNGQRLEILHQLQRVLLPHQLLPLHPLQLRLGRTGRPSMHLLQQGLCRSHSSSTRPSATPALHRQRAHVLQ